MRKRKVILDTDLNFPSDDFEALGLLVDNPIIELIGITATAGNTWMEEVFFHILAGLQALGNSSIPVYPGESFSKSSTWLNWDYVAAAPRDFYGAYSKGPKPRLTDDEKALLSTKTLDAAQFIIEASHQHKGRLEIICLGPLTNLASAVNIDPSLTERIARVYIMGGRVEDDECLRRQSDFNFWFNSIAAHCILGSSLPITLITANLGDQAVVEQTLHKQICQAKGNRWELFTEDYLNMCQQHGRPLPLRDQLTALVAIYPELIEKTSRGEVKVMTNAERERGHMLFKRKESSSVELVEQVNLKLLQKKLLRHLKQSYRASPSTVEEFSQERYRFLSEPHLRSKAQAWLLKKPLQHLQIHWDGKEFKDGAEETISTWPAFKGLTEKLLVLLERTKRRGELWPPCSIIDKVIDSFPHRTFYFFDDLAYQELGQYCFQRLLEVDTIVTIVDDSRRCRGFSCLSTLDSKRALELSEQYATTISQRAAITEFGMVDRSFRGHRTFELMNTRLISEWSQRDCAKCDPKVYGVVLDNQKASRHVVEKLGYRKIAQHTIESGPEVGRLLHLFERSWSKGVCL